MDVAKILENAILNPDAARRSEAEAQLTALADADWLGYLSTMVQVLAEESNRTEVRILAGLGLKNQLTSKDPIKKTHQAEKWLSIDPQIRSSIKDNSLKSLLTENDRVANTAAQLVAAIADIELPVGQWEQLVYIIVENTKTEKPVNVKRASLLTLGYICETADPTNPAVIAQSDAIFVAIVQGAHDSEPSTVVRITALNALVHSLEFIQVNFEREGERNYLMQVVCQATQASDEELQALAFGALAKIMSLYYPHMKVYMEKALYGITVGGMQSQNDKVSCMAVEFWSTVCEEELEIAIEREDYGEGESYNFALSAITDVLPTLLQLLTRQNEDAEDDDWSVAMAAGACLQLFAQNTANYVVQPVLQFVEENLGKDNWRNREASVMAFGSILEGPDRDQLKVLIRQALAPILNLIRDDSLQVKETVAWCLGKIADVIVDAIDTETMLPEVMGAILVGLKDHPKVSTNCSWTLINLIEQLCSDGATSQTTVLSPCYAELVPILIELSASGENEFSARTSSYEALSTLVLYSSESDTPIVNQIASEMINRLDSTIEMQKALNSSSSTTNEERQNLSEIQSNILSLITNVIRRFGSAITTHADTLMEKFLTLLQLQDATSIIEEDIFIAISAIASAVDQYFSAYMQSFLPFLTKALENTDSPVCEAAIGLVVDISHSLDKDFIPYCQGFMVILGSIFSNQNSRRELKPLILSCFGDIASSIGSEFIQYLPDVMNICLSAQSLNFEETSYDSGYYVLEIQEAVLNTYVGIVTGLQSVPEAVSPYFGQIFDFLLQIYSSQDLSSKDAVCRSAVGMIGDITSFTINGTKDARLQTIFSQDWITDFIRKTRSNPRFSQSTKDTARWARDKQKEFLATPF